ncbi:MAG: hypothetical protein E7060_03980 [Treponema bryantii]|nr:hypothetical protein [Treponema bryantii]
MNTKLKTIFLILLSVMFFSCNDNKEKEIKFDTSHPLELSPNISWAVIIDPYAAFRIDLDWDSSVAAYSRKGDILQVLAKSYDEKSAVWYKFEQGWLPESSVTIYSNRLKAKNASEKIK